MCHFDFSPPLKSNKGFIEDPQRDDLFIASATHNLISLFRKKVLFGTGIEDLGIQTITNKLTDIPAKLEKEQNKMRIFFPAGHELARRFIQGKQNNHKGSIFPLEKKLYN